MSQSDRMIVTDLYLRRFGREADGTASRAKPHITHHWVTDAGKVAQKHMDEQALLRSQGKAFQIIEVATQDEYRDYKWPNRTL